jgi:hypothetical protein
MEIDRNTKNLDQLASRDISVVSGGATVGEVAAGAADAAWLVVTGPDEQPLGLLSRARLARADDDRQQVIDLITRPVIVLPAHLPVAAALRSWTFHDLKNELADLDGVILVDHDDTPVAALPGQDVDRYLPPAAARLALLTYVDTGLPGPITNIGRIVRLCRFVGQPARTKCAAVRSFSAKPATPPDCDNPHRLRPHAFKW